ncbi:MAG: hypothetical protein GY870_09615 [archaeon]|nr:hypothetical protein [archaeon]
MSTLNCVGSFVNSGSPDCKFNPGPVIGYILTPTSGTIADEATAILEATWKTGINGADGSRWFPVLFNKYLQGVAPSNDDPIFEDGIGGIRAKIREGNKRDAITFSNLPLCLSKALKSYDDANWKAYAVTENGYILGTSSNGTLFDPFSIRFHSKPSGNAEQDASMKTTYFIDYTDPAEFDVYGAFVKPTAFKPKNLEGIKNYLLTLVSASTSEIVVTVDGACDGVGKTGLVKEDFLLQINGGAVVPLASITEDSTILGKWTLVGSGAFTTVLHDLQIKDQPDTTTKGIESDSIAVTPA